MDSEGELRGRLRRRPGDRVAALLVEQVQLVERDLEVEHVAGLDPVLRAHHGNDVGIMALDRDVEQLLVAEELHDVGLGANRRRVRQVAQLHVLRPEASDELVRTVKPAPVAARDREGHAAAFTESPSRSTLTKFIAGLPMNPATKSFFGFSYRSCGAPTCCSSPLSMTAMRVPIVMASTWSWVT